MVSLQGQSVKLREFYRMDTQRPAGSEAYDWPMTVLRDRGLRPSDIGVKAFTVVGGKALYLPLRLGGIGRDCDTTRYRRPTGFERTAASWPRTIRSTGVTDGHDLRTRLGLTVVQHLHAPGPYRKVVSGFSH